MQTWAAFRGHVYPWYNDASLQLSWYLLFVYLSVY